MWRTDEEDDDDYDIPSIYKRVPGSVCVKWLGITFVSKFNLTDCERPKVCNFVIVFLQSVTCEQTFLDTEWSISVMIEHLLITVKDAISLVVLHTQAEIFFYMIWTSGANELPVTIRNSQCEEPNRYNHILLCRLISAWYREKTKFFFMPEQCNCTVASLPLYF